MIEGRSPPTLTAHTLTPAERASIAAALRHWREYLPYHRRALQTKPHAALSDAEIAALVDRLNP